MAVSDFDNLRVACRMRFLNAADVINVWHMQFVSGGPFAEVDAFDIIQAHMHDAYLGLVGSLPPELSFADITVQNLTQNLIVGSGDWAGLTQGGGGAEGMPPQVANLVVFPTAVPRAQGRKYVPAFTEGLYDNGLLSAGAIGLLGTWSNFFWGVQTSPSSTFQFGTYSNSPAHFYSLLSAKVIPALRTQRRRTVGFGS